MKIHVNKDKIGLTDELAYWMSGLINDTLKKQESFSLVLSGGETPKLLFKKLATQEMREKIDWKRVHIFWGDERVVPFTDGRNNAKIAYDILISNINIPSDNVNIMRTDIEPNFSVDAYRKLLRGYFHNSTKSFDLVLLGMGNDGHTLSLFPGSDIIEDHLHWVNSIYLPSQKIYRITLMPALVNRASHIAFMVEGSAKSAILQQVIEGEYKPKELPAQIIKPVNGELHWFVDEAAAKKLQGI